MKTWVRCIAAFIFRLRLFRIMCYASMFSGWTKIIHITHTHVYYFRQGRGYATATDMSNIAVTLKSGLSRSLKMTPVDINQSINQSLNFNVPIFTNKNPE